MELDPATLRVGQRVRVVSGFGGQVVGTIVLLEEAMNGIREVTLDTGVMVLASAPGDPMPLNRFFAERAATPPPRKPVRARETPGRKLERGAARRRKTRRTRRPYAKSIGVLVS